MALSEVSGTKMETPLAGIGNRSHSVGGPSVIPYPEPYGYPDLEHGGIKLQWSSHSARDRPGAS
jgi:hypothetical protein